MTERDKKALEQDEAITALRDKLVEAEKTDGGLVGWSRERWWEEVWQQHGKIGPNRVIFFVVRIGAVAGAAAIPVFATAGTLTSGHTWGWVTVAVSLLIALLLAFDQVYRPGERWRTAYQVYHELVDAGWNYLEARMPGTDGKAKQPYWGFVNSVELSIIDYGREYLRDIANLNTGPPTKQTTKSVARDQEGA
jgi:hypothetical protein